MLLCTVHYWTASCMMTAAGYSMLCTVQYITVCIATVHVYSTTYTVRTARIQQYNSTRKKKFCYRYQGDYSLSSVVFFPQYTVLYVRMCTYCTL